MNTPRENIVSTNVDINVESQEIRRFNKLVELFQKLNLITARQARSFIESAFIFGKKGLPMLFSLLTGCIFFMDPENNANTPCPDENTPAFTNKDGDKLCYENSDCTPAEDDPNDGVVCTGTSDLPDGGVPDDGVPDMDTDMNPADMGVDMNPSDMPDQSSDMDSPDMVDPCTPEMRSDVARLKNTVKQSLTEIVNGIRVIGADYGGFRFTSSKGDIAGYERGLAGEQNVAAYNKDGVSGYWAFGKGAIGYRDVLEGHTSENTADSLTAIKHGFAPRLNNVTTLPTADGVSFEITVDKGNGQVTVSGYETTNRSYKLCPELLEEVTNY